MPAALTTTDQIQTAQVIRRFRDLDMPLDQIHAVLEAPDLGTRNELISAHLASLEQNLIRTQSAVASLRNLLDGPSASRRSATAGSPRRRRRPSPPSSR